MNAVAQILKKQLEQRDALLQQKQDYIRFLEYHLERLIADLEYTESVGAAFAFDVVRNHTFYVEGMDVVDELVLQWDEAVEAQREVSKPETQKQAEALVGL